LSAVYVVIRDATECGNRSLQSPAQFPWPASPFDEDCLYYLNVTAPVGRARAPVLFGVHGGG